LSAEPLAKSRTVVQMTGSVFFDERDRLVTPRLGEVIRQAGDLRTGVDGRLWRYDGGVYRTDGDAFARDQVRELLGDECRRVHFEEVMTWLRSFPPSITGEASTRHLNLADGMLDWRSCELSRHDPEHCSTIQLPVRWNPEARCPRFSQFLVEAMPKDAGPFVEEILGYGLLPDNPFHKAVLLKGPAGNGKSTFIHVAEHLYGRENVSHRELVDIAENRFAPADLLGKLANLCGDIDARALRQSSTFKTITGGDTIAAERKFGQPFSFRPFALLIFSANEAPFSADQSEAWFDRWLIVPMTERFRGTEREEPHLRDRLASEIEGVLVLAVNGLRRLMERGRFEPPESVRVAGEDYREQLDTAIGFIAEGCVLHPDAWVPRPALYKAYRQWCQDSGRLPTSAVHFYARLRQHFADQIEDRIRRGSPGFAGIGLLAEGG
jgi:putative DNA primase/helicase